LLSDEDMMLALSSMEAACGEGGVFAFGSARNEFGNAV
jgi:hypothetical protein